jgi:hypothetical protein
MTKKDFLPRNPLRLLGQEDREILPQGKFGAVLARAGVGKTAMMVQLSMETLLRNKNVLHVSIDDPVNKVSLWYKEVFHNLVDQFHLQQVSRIWESLLPHRFIMTFNVEAFSTPKLKERLADLTEQAIFRPNMIIIDGLPFDSSINESLNQLKAFSKKHELAIWFSVRTHRHEETGSGGLPPQLMDLDHLFDVIIQLQPEGKDIHIKTLKGYKDVQVSPDLLLDPVTMLIHQK